MKTTLVLSFLCCVSLTFAQIGKTHTPKPHTTPEPTTQEPNPEAEFDCDACIVFTTVIKDLVIDEIAIDEVERDADTLCAILPRHLREYCQHELLPKTDRIYEMLYEHTPQWVCDKLNFC
ncbi:uncharacterized protein LOC114329038 [Diabrotica virgifera virgifera]|uniref:Uncharacterized protein LOC114329038 n=1 Tax=Diabrotica virgifera virgifera TaxID=50390 RepID=A0A6P7FDU1_DIAVI|nr:uncharacterized protein LOC114329038 [Diabrotica virgifera virgifera]